MGFANLSQRGTGLRPAFARVGVALETRFTVNRVSGCLRAHGVCPDETWQNATLSSCLGVGVVAGETERIVRIPQP